MTNRLSNPDLKLKIPFDFKKALIEGFDEQLHEKVQQISTELYTFKASSADDTLDESNPRTNFGDRSKDSVLKKNMSFLKECYNTLNNETQTTPEDGFLVKEYNELILKNIDAVDIFSEVLNYYESSQHSVEQIWIQMSKRIVSLKQNGDLSQKLNNIEENLCSESNEMNLNEK